MKSQANQWVININPGQTDQSSEDFSDSRYNEWPLEGFNHDQCQPIYNSVKVCLHVT